MRVLVTGAGGYVGGRLVPVLLDRGHDVVASFSSDRPRGHWWSDRVRTVVMDVLDEQQVRAAVRGVDAVFYLIHGLASHDFADRDRRGAELVAAAAADAGVQRIVYLSGLVPDVPERRLSPHIASRLEVERILTGSGVPTLTARAAIVIGSGSTSFEIVRHVSERLPVLALPPWITAEVQPIAVVDVLEILTGALDAPAENRAYDIGGPDRTSYGDLLRLYADVARLLRPRLRLPLSLPAPAGRFVTPAPRAAGSHSAGQLNRLAGELTGRMTGVPAPTVAALLESLRHDMVCSGDTGQSRLLPEGHRLLGVREAVERALTRPRAGVRPEHRDPMGALPTDPPWTGGGVYLFEGEVRHRPRSALDRLLLGPRRPW